MKKMLFLLALLFGMLAATPIQAEEISLRPSISFNKAYVHRLIVDISSSTDAITDHGGVAYYQVTYGKKFSLPKPKQKNVSGDSSQFVLKNLRSGQEYYVYVVAHYNDGDTSWKVYLDGAQSLTSAYTRPNRPRFLRVKERAPGSVLLTWRKPYRNSAFTRHEVEWYDATTSEIVGSRYIVTYDTDRLQIEQLTPDTRYYYRVRSQIFYFEKSNWSDPKYFRTVPE